MTLRVCDLQSDSDLGSIRNSTDVSLGDPCLLEMAKVLLTAPARLPPALVVRDKQSLSTSPPPSDSQIRDIGSQWPFTGSVWDTPSCTKSLLRGSILKIFHLDPYCGA